MQNIPDPLLTFRWRLAETIAWCDTLGSLADPANSLRTPALEPPIRTTASARGDVWPEWGDAQERQATLSVLLETRAYLLKVARLYPAAPATNVANGRLLVSCSPDESVFCGLAELETSGFMDVGDNPPWDTWVWYDEEPVTYTPEDLRRWGIARYWLCWIPHQFISLVDEGMAVHPVDCFWWAAAYKEKNRKYETSLLRSLDAEGFLT